MRPPPARLTSTLLALLAVLTPGVCGRGQVPSRPGQHAPDASDTLFGKGEILRIRLEVPTEELEKLRKDPRAYVKACLRSGEKAPLLDVGLKLKGAAGSFREWDDRPALTLKADRIVPGQRFHGLAKLHLNNSVQDESLLHELVASEALRLAGVPATRVTHARVWLDGRDVGLYVLKEGFDRLFLTRHFARPEGNLYDGGFCQDLDAELEKDNGDGPDDRSDLKALLEATQETSPSRRAERIAERLDVEAFLAFMAAELMLGHWDGYTQNRNNYRLYFDPGAKDGLRARFLPHGMDQILGDAGAPILDMPTSILGAAVMKHPAWRARYRKRLEELLPVFSPPDRLLRKVDEAAARLRPVLEAMDSGAARHHAGLVRDLKSRLVARGRSLRGLAAEPEPKPLAFGGDNTARPRNWRRSAETEDTPFDEVRLPGEKALRIRVGPSGKCVGSWRATVLLAPGRYRFTGSVQTRGVNPIPGEEASPGASLRISGLPRGATLSGTSGPKTLDCEFTIEDEPRDIELVAELRASAGEALFRTDTLRLVRLLR